MHLSGKCLETTKSTLYRTYNQEPSLVPRCAHLIFSASKSLCGGRLNFFLLANQSFCGRQVTHVGEVRKEGWPPARLQCSPIRHHSPRYQAHAGLDAVVVDAWDHLQGDGVLAGLDVVHLEGSSRSAGPSRTALTLATSRQVPEGPEKTKGEICLLTTPRSLCPIQHFFALEMNIYCPHLGI